MASAKKEAEKVLNILVDRTSKTDSFPSYRDLVRRIIIDLKQEVRGTATLKEVVNELYKKVL